MELDWTFDHCEWLLGLDAAGVPLVEVNYDFDRPPEQDPTVVIRNGAHKAIIWPHLIGGVGVAVAIFCDGRLVGCGRVGDVPEGA